MTTEQEAPITIPTKILVIDDEARIRDGCRTVLKEVGYDVTVAEDGAKGLTCIEKTDFDIVLLDLMMPKMSGFEVLAKIRRHHPDTVVIVITGYATVEHSIEAMKSGAFDFIPKPFTPDHLRVTVSKALDYTRALRDIADTRSRMRTMVQRLSDGVMCTNQENRIVMVNPAFLKMVGCAGVATAMGQSCDAVISTDRIRQMIAQTLATSDEDTLDRTDEIEHGENDEGEPRILSIRCTPFRDRTGATLGVITVLHDITTLKKLDRMKSEFVSRVSHEIRGPMNSVLMQLQVILDGLAGKVTDKQQEILRRASEKIRNLALMTTELLDLSRIESGLICQEMETVDLARLLREQIEFQRPRAASASIRLEMDVPDRLPPVTGHPRNLEEAFSNLIGNAIKYTPAGGKVRVSAASGPETLTVKVTDTGIGIAEEDQKRLFQRFYRVRNEQTRYIQGTGLGLSLVKKIVESHNGRVEVESRPGRGTTFSVSLPNTAT
ncbi:MAG: response regulator [Desulfobacterales bacterium]